LGSLPSGASGCCSGNAPRQARPSVSPDHIVAAKPPVSKQLSLSEAAKLHARFFSTYPRLKLWQRTQSARVERAHKWTATTILGRKVWCAKQDDSGRRKFHYTLSLNAPVQGSGADLMHVALGKLPAALAGLDACPVLFVHDEIVLEVADKDADEAGRRLEAS
jgi:DNA polymerase-1